MRVKICGITSLKDALLCVEAGADALGFVFYHDSPRYIAPEKAREIIEALPPFVEPVGLFVNLAPEAIDRICQESGVGLAQIHFDVDEDFLERVQTRTLPVVRARQREDVERFHDRYRLVDAYCESYGGSGKRLNLEWFGDTDRSKIVLAGGLTPENVSEVAGQGFYAVDVSSGTEAEKGVKDPRKVEMFVAHAKGI